MFKTKVNSDPDRELRQEVLSKPKKAKWQNILSQKHSNFLDLLVKILVKNGKFVEAGSKNS